jgi:hypothetical protein
MIAVVVTVLALWGIAVWLILLFFQGCARVNVESRRREDAGAPDGIGERTDRVTRTAVELKGLPPAYPR